MSIIYSYPEQSTLNAGDMLIGTSVEKIGGKQKNVTKNFTVQQIADFINRGTGIVDPVATDFQIAVFNQGGTKLTGSIISQDSSLSNGVAGTGITIAGILTTTGNITTNANLSAFGVVTLGSQNNLISLNSTTKLGGPIQDSTGTLGDVNQILLSNGSGDLSWQNYAAGLTYQGVWNAATNTPTLVSGTGTNGHFYIVDVLGNTNLNGNTDWQVGDWALFSGVTGAGGFWDKIDNTQSLTGSGTTNTMTMWTSPSAIGNSLISQAGTVVSVNASLKVKDTVEATTTNANLKLKGAGTGGVEIMGDTASATDGRIQLNCYVNSHGVTIQSPPHSDSATYTLILPSSVGTVGQVLTSAGSGAGAQLTWSSPTVGTVTSINYTTDFTAFTAGPAAAITTAGTFTLNKNGGTAGQYIDGAAGAWTNLPVTGVTSISSAVTAIPGLTLVTTNPNTTPVITLGLAATAGSGEYLDGGTGQWTTLPVTGVTSVSGTANRISVTGGNTAVVDAVTGVVNSTSNNLATGSQIQTAIDAALSGAITFKGTFDASTGTITGGTDKLYNPGANSNTIAVAIGDMYVASVAGNFFGNASTPLSVGDEVIATVASTISPSVSVESNYSAVPSSGGAFLPLSGGTLTGGLTGTSATFSGVLTVGNSGTSRFTDTSAFPLQLNRGLDVDSAGANGAILGIGTLKAGTYKDGIRIIGALKTNGTDGNFALQTLGGNVYSDALAIDPNQQSTFSGNVILNGALTQTTNVVSSFIGNVGVGTTSPGTARLKIIGSSANNGLSILAGGNGGTYPFMVSYSGGAEGIALCVDDALNVGIGTNLPAVSLDISATDAVQMPKGTTAQRPTAAEGMLRYSTTDNGFEGYINGAWGTLGGTGASATITTRSATTINATTTVFALGATPNGGSTSFVDVFVDGVYQEINTYSVTGTTNITFGTALPSGVTVETKTTADYNVGAAVASVNGMTGSVLLNAPTLVTGNINALNGGLYIFDSATIYTLTLPTSPSAGDSIKISNGISGAANIIAPGSKKIMDVAGNMTINLATAAFEMIFSGDANGWIIIGNI